MMTRKFWVLLTMALFLTEAQGITRSYCKYRARCPSNDGTSRYCACCKYTSYFGGYQNCGPSCNRNCRQSANVPPPVKPIPTPTTPTTTTPTTTTPTTTTTYKPHEETDNMIDQFSSLWPQTSEDTLLTVDEGTDELIVIDISLVQEDNVDLGTFSFRKGRCGKFPQAVSIESKRHTGKFWRHQEGKIKIEGGEDTDDICFNVVKAGCEDGGFALQATNIPGKFVQKCGAKIELRTRADNCGDVKNMCWANPVSEQAVLAFCEVKVTTNDDVYEYPQCCSHEATLEKFGECCRENITSCSNCPILALPNSYSYIHWLLRRFPKCCMESLVKDYKGPHESWVHGICQQLGMRVKPAACNYACWRISYCPMKMRQNSGWEMGYKECCCHPYRKALIKKGKGYPGTCSGLG